MQQFEKQAPGIEAVDRRKGMTDVQQTEPIPDRNYARVVSSESGSRKKSGRRTRRITIEIPITLFERMANAIYWTDEMNLSQFCIRAFSEYVDHLERENGAPFRERKKSSRTVSSGKRRVDIVV
jgi:hypothetical protein